MYRSNLLVSPITPGDEIVHADGRNAYRVFSRRLVCLLVLWLSLGTAAKLSAAAPAAPDERRAESAADFPELSDTWRVFERFLAGNTIAASRTDQAAASELRSSCLPIPCQSEIRAYEEHRLFLLALGPAAKLLASGPPTNEAAGRPAAVRRVLFLKPSLLVVDDLVSVPAAGNGLTWVVACRSAATAAGAVLQIRDGDQQLVCQTVWPPAEAGTAWQAAADSLYQTAASPQAGAKTVRWLHVLAVQPAAERDAGVQATVEARDNELDVTITAADRRVQLRLPPPGGDAGWIAMQDPAGQTTLANRPLPAGVLPHGPEAARMLERWDSAYRDGRRPGWDTGVPADDLRQAVEQGAIKPCRTVELGCGSGTNAIYLASRGFDVTAIDVSPTALSLAAAKAEQAGVRVRWVLADVLRLPALEPFDLIFDRGCYHNLRYVDAPGFVASLQQLSRPGTRCLILSLNRDGPPGVREQHMRDDLSTRFDFEWLRPSVIDTVGGGGATAQRASWNLLLRRK